MAANGGACACACVSLWLALPAQVDFIAIKRFRKPGRGKESAVSGEGSYRGYAGKLASPITVACPVMISRF